MIFRGLKLARVIMRYLRTFEIKTCNRSGPFGRDIVICEMNKSKKNLASWIVNFASSNLFLRLVFALFIIQAVYLAVSINSGTGPDEAFHMGAIGFFAKEGIFSLFSNGPQISDFYLGSIYSRPDIAYHYIFSYLFSALSPFVTNESLVLIIKLLNVLIATFSLYVLKLLADAARISPLARNLGLFWVSNMLMFVFLSGSVNCDNLSLLLIFSSYLFLIRFYQTKFLKYLLLLGATAFLGPLVKVTHLAVLPFELIAVIIVLYGSLNKKFINKWWLEINNNRISFLLITTVLISSAGLLTFRLGSNIHSYGDYNPKCAQVLTVEQCQENGIYRRSESLPKKDNPALDTRGVDKMSYLADWLLLMHNSSYGIKGHKTLMPPSPISYGMFLFFVLSIVATIRTYDSKRDTVVGFYILLFLSFSWILISKNYGTYVKTSVINLAVQGRYIMPVFLPLIVIGVNHTLRLITSNRPRALYIIILTVFCLAGASPRFIYGADATWYTRQTRQVNIKLNHIMHSLY